MQLLRGLLLHSHKYFYFCCLSFFDDCHQSRYSSWCLLRGSSFTPLALSRNSSILSDEAKSPQLLQIKLLLARSYFSSPPHSGQKLAKRSHISITSIKGFQPSKSPITMGLEKYSFPPRPLYCYCHSQARCQIIPFQVAI